MERVQLVPVTGEIAQLTPDYAARKVIVAAFLYYVLDSPQMNDARYDRLSEYVADHWDELHGDRRWALRDPASIRAGGSHIWFSMLAAGAALNAYKYQTGKSMLIDHKSIKKTKKGQPYVTTHCQVYRDRT